MMSRNFPPQPDSSEPGADALLDAQRQLTVIEKAGVFFVPPHNESGLAAAVFSPPAKRGKPTSGRLSVRKRVVDPNDPSRRFERRGFRFQIRDAQGQPLPGSEFATDSTGRGRGPVELQIGENYSLEELESPVPNVQLQSIPFVMEKRNQLLRIENQVTQPNTPYGG